jgi:ferric-dicitrate binding protein FerR (iron transport regulator)
VNKEIENARQAGRRLAKVCDRLQRPTLESWRASETDLMDAVESLRDLEQSLHSVGAAKPVSSSVLAAEIAAIRREMATAQALLAAAGNFYQGWARLLETGDDQTANYTSSGTAASVVSIQSGQMVVHG